MTSRAGSDRARRVGINLLRWYPRPWRARYGREMKALLEDMPVGWRQVANLTGTAVREWMSPRALGWPARSAAERLMIARMFMFLALAYALDGVARIVASNLLAAKVTISETIEDNVTWILMAMTLRGILAMTFRMKRFQQWQLIKRHAWLRQLSDWEVVTWLVLLLPYRVLRYALPTPEYYTEGMRALRPYENVYLVFLFTFFLSRNSARRIRLWKVHLASLRRPLGLSN